MEKKARFVTIVTLVTLFTFTLFSGYSTPSLEKKKEGTCYCYWNGNASVEWQQKCYRGYKYECSCRNGCPEWEYVGTCY